MAHGIHTVENGTDEIKQTEANFKRIQHKITDVHLGFRPRLSDYSSEPLTP
jgi:hypothetical protein